MCGKLEHQFFQFVFPVAKFSIPPLPLLEAKIQVSDSEASAIHLLSKLVCLFALDEWNETISGWAVWHQLWVLVRVSFFFLCLFWLAGVQFPPPLGRVFDCATYPRKGYYKSERKSAESEEPRGSTKRRKKSVIKWRFNGSVINWWRVRGCPREE